MIQEFADALKVATDRELLTILRDLGDEPEYQEAVRKEIAKRKGTEVEI